MIWSVFDWHIGQYRYYDGPGEGLGVRPEGVRINDDAGHHRLEDVLPRVPAGSKRVGEGDEPRGRIAVAAAEGGFGDAANPLATSPWLTLGLWAAGVWVAYRLSEWIGKQAEKRL